MTADVTIHPTAEVSGGAEIGAGTRIWHQAQVREGAWLGRQCIVGKGAYIDHDVEIGNRVKIQNYALIYHGATLEDGVFVGPHACLSNDKVPRAITPDGELKGDSDWQVGSVAVRYGASVGAGAIVLPGVTIGRFAMVGAGAVVTTDVPDYGLAVGLPARLAGYVCCCGQRLKPVTDGSLVCCICQQQYGFVGSVTSDAARTELRPAAED
jgi:acetyltransferase-like isoleucine patch superfamily enzyme